MNIPHIKIDQTFARLGVSIQPSKMEIQTDNSRINLQMESLEVEIQQRSAEIHADWKPVWDEIGLKKPGDLALDIKGRAENKTLEAIGQIVKEGKRLGNLASGEQTVIANVQKEKFFSNAEVHTNIGLIPINQPVFKVETYSPRVKATLGDIQVNPNSIDPVINYQVSKISVYWIQQPNVDIYV